MHTTDGNSGEDTAAPAAPVMPEITFDDFQRIDVRVGVITHVEEFPRARVPAWKVTLDFGPELGTRRSSMQATNYTPEQLIGLQVVAVVNFPPKNIAGFRSEVLVLGAPSEDGTLSILSPTRIAQVGSRIY